MPEIFQKLKFTFSQIDFLENHSLALYTTVKIGGPAEIFCEVRAQQDFIDLVKFARKNNIKFTVLGTGANTLISDKGIKGLVIRNLAGEIKVLDENYDQKLISTADSAKVEARWQADESTGSFKYDFKDLDYDESNEDRVLVEIDAGVFLNTAIFGLLDKGITGLQWYARIPSTIGGAVFNNLHGGTHFLSEVLESATVIDNEGEIVELNAGELKLGYDESRFHDSGEIIISAKFNLYNGDVARAQEVIQKWSQRKSLQPQNSLGCVFANISNQDKQRLGYPTTSVGYILEHVLKLKGFRIGEAMISDKHCAFIENKGEATATDYLAVIKKIIKEVKEETGLSLRPEISFLGFEKSELEGIVSF